MKKNQSRKCKIGFVVVFVSVLFISMSCKNETVQNTEITTGETVYRDTPFIQEFHDAYKISENDADNEIRSIAVDQESNIWVATASGVFYKKNNTRTWEKVITGQERGPAYSVRVKSDSSVMMGTWNGLYTFKNNKITKAKGLTAPISVICNNGNENYALGPNGIWHSNGNKWEYLNYKIARSVRDAIADSNGNLWVATDVGIYFCNKGTSELFQSTDELISCYASALSFAPGNKLWVGAMGGVSIRENNKLVRNMTPKDGIPSAFVNCISQSPEGVMWVGTKVGVVRFDTDGSRSLRFSQRWLTDNHVNDVAFDKDGNAWIATDNGVSAIKRIKMTLADKQSNFYSQLMKKHIREPWICGNLRLEIPGDTSTWQNSDDDNDGEYTGGYLAMESFRYVVTGDEDALIKARKAFAFLKKLRTVSGTDGLFARTIVPANWTRVHDGNRTYSEKQVAEALVNDPRYKPVEKRWRKSADGKWLWKGDTSSDEVGGHMMAYFYFYEYAATEKDKVEIREHVKDIIDGLIRHNYNFVDIDGKHTRWGVWSPEQLNNNPDWASEKSLNSFELLTYLKFAYGITGDELYQKKYLHLINNEGYLENAKGINSKNPAWQIYFDRTMEGYMFPILFRYETDSEIRAIYREMLDIWITDQESGENLVNNLAYTLCTGKKINVKQTIDFLKDTPLDLVDWRIDHTLREDVQIVRSPILEEIQVSELPLASERATVRWDKNPWAAIHGNPSQVREPVFWLWPYWEARYLKIIENQH
uniref:ligand-binding sensor domain-containing protein n=1 Tax=uncultured Draconibacterium sp. TaxID=1573823 RepID=UPI003217A9DF